VFGASDASKRSVVGSVEGDSEQATRCVLIPPKESTFGGDENGTVEMASDASHRFDRCTEVDRFASRGQGEAQSSRKPRCRAGQKERPRGCVFMSATGAYTVRSSSGVLSKTRSTAIRP